MNYFWDVSDLNGELRDPVAFFGTGETPGMKL
jgi:hypothetical protein